MKRKTKIIIFIVVIVVVLLPVYLLNAVNRKIEERENIVNEVSENKIETKNEEKNEIAENKITSENTSKEENTNTATNTVENTIANDNTTSNTTTNTNTNTTAHETTSVKNPSEKAIQIAKEDWGEDDNTVYFSYDGIDGTTGNYIIGVRDSSTTYIKCWYYVDVKTGEFSVKR